MTRPQSGYYFYSPSTGVCFYDSHLYVTELAQSCILVCPALFHQIVHDHTATETCMTYYHESNPLIHDLHFVFDIKGLYEY